MDKILKTEGKLSDVKEKIVFDIASCQMSIHYMFEKQEKLEAFFQNVTDRLEPGCFFIGTTVDSDEVLFRIRQKGGSNNSISNDFMSLILP